MIGIEGGAIRSKNCQRLYYHEFLRAPIQYLTSHHSPISCHSRHPTGGTQFSKRILFSSRLYIFTLKTRRRYFGGEVKNPVTEILIGWRISEIRKKIQMVTEILDDEASRCGELRSSENVLQVLCGLQGFTRAVLVFLAKLGGANLERRRVFNQTPTIFCAALITRTHWCLVVFRFYSKFRKQPPFAFAVFLAGLSGVILLHAERPRV